MPIGNSSAPPNFDLKTSGIAASAPIVSAATAGCAFSLQAPSLKQTSGGTIRLNAGSLYRLLASLVDDGLVEPAEEVANPAGAGAPRKLYALRDFGRAVLAAEARRQAELLEMARALNLLEGA